MPLSTQWNKIEHRLFSFISKNWRGKPLESLEVIVQLIANTTTQKGLQVKALADRRVYEKEIKVSDKELSEIQLERDVFRGGVELYHSSLNVSFINERLLTIKS